MAPLLSRMTNFQRAIPILTTSRETQMDSGFRRVLISFGAILMSFGITFLIIELLGARYGTPHRMGGILAAVGLIGGAVLFGLGTMMKRSSKNRTG